MRRLSDSPLTAAEALALLRAHLPPVDGPVVLAVSGGPDSTAMMGLYALARQEGALPEALVVTVNHGLRAAAQQEAVSVGALARKFGFAHRILMWDGDKPVTGVQDAARRARYGLIGAFAAEQGARVVMLAHTLDDQAETVMMRLMRGSGLAGLGGMEPLSHRPGFWLLRPFLSISKSRLAASCAAENWPTLDDPSNRNSDFTRVRLRRLMPLLAEEGLDAQRLAVFARRMQGAAEALEMAARRALNEAVTLREGRRGYDAARIAGEPTEVVTTVFSQLIAATRGTTGADSPARLNRIEALALRFSGAVRAGVPFAATLGGVHFALAGNLLSCAKEPPRRLHHSLKSADQLGNRPDAS